LDILEACGASDKKGLLLGEKNNNFSLNKNVGKRQLDEHIKLLKISGLSEKWLYDIRRFITDYLDYVEWTTDKNKTLDYLALAEKTSGWYLDFVRFNFLNNTVIDTTLF
jgi:hypothetical protein